MISYRIIYPVHIPEQAANGLAQTQCLQQEFYSQPNGGPSWHVYEEVLASKCLGGLLKYLEDSCWTMCDLCYTHSLVTDILMVQDCSNSSVFAMELLQFYTKPLMVKYKTAVTPLLMQWSYCRLALSHWYSPKRLFCMATFVLYPHY